MHLDDDTSQNARFLQFKYDAHFTRGKETSNAEKKKALYEQLNAVQERFPKSDTAIVMI